MAKKHPVGNVKPEYSEQGGGKRDTYTYESGAVRVAEVMKKAEATHATGSKMTGGANFRLETNQAKHTSGGDNGGGFRE